MNKKNLIISVGLFVFASVLSLSTGKDRMSKYDIHEASGGTSSKIKLGFLEPAEARMPACQYIGGGTTEDGRQINCYDCGSECWCEYK